MTDRAKNARSAMRAKAQRLTLQEELSRALAHHRRMAEEIEAELHGGANPAKPKRRRKNIGSVEGERAVQHAGKKPRAGKRRYEFASGGAPFDGDLSGEGGVDDTIQNLGRFGANVVMDPNLAAHQAADAFMHPIETAERGADVAMHPVEALDSLGDLAKGIASRAASSIGPQQATRIASNRHGRRG